MCWIVGNLDCCLLNLPPFSKQPGSETDSLLASLLQSTSTQDQLIPRITETSAYSSVVCETPIIDPIISLYLPLEDFGLLGPCDCHEKAMQLVVTLRLLQSISKPDLLVVEANKALVRGGLSIRLLRRHIDSVRVRSFVCMNIRVPSC